MALAWKPQPREVLQSWISALLDEAYESMTEWEKSFVSDVEVKVHNNWTLTQKQEETLEKIYAEKTK